MGMDYDTRLLDGAKIVEHTGVQDLANLATDNELVLDTFALQATRAVFRHLQASGVDPEALTNEDHYKDAVAYEAVVRLARAGYLSGVDLSEMRTARDEALRVRPVYSSADSPRLSSEGIPAVGHLDGGPTFFGSLDVEPPSYFSDAFPSSS